MSHQGLLPKAAQEMQGWGQNEAVFTDVSSWYGPPQNNDQDLTSS